ncbi:isochorismatase family protein [Lacticaseibacillus sharpeae]|uniref:Isochorismatase-like domain-containing protein n=1 Tax=Lacticaseibacillus sharpeae JCM 1186 = DSM 20505 TaxID=1291052 RepID=A0A0R1ZW10_9LACO|nr:isochorismatase family protein [Lacticaseibacillus sharpeae]KRM55020.1 hypothetical protein FC18_GL001727 [Lacticaseibacillus sharpeae JCM 1186 = DSM 20505]
MLNLAHTALVVIDLQEDILNAAPLAPNSLDDMLTANTRLTTVLKNTSALIALVSVETATFTHLYPFAAEKRSIPTLTNAPDLSLPIASDQSARNVIRVTKHNPGAFVGTDLDVQLRRFGIDTIILTGVSTSNGVYATALDAFQYAYNVIVLEDACSDRDEEKHNFFFNKMFGRIARVATTDEIIGELGEE